LCKIIFKIVYHSLNHGRKIILMKDNSLKICLHCIKNLNWCSRLLMLIMLFISNLGNKPKNIWLVNPIYLIRKNMIFLINLIIHIRNLLDWKIRMKYKKCSCNNTQNQTKKRKKKVKLKILKILKKFSYFL